MDLALQVVKKEDVLDSKLKDLAEDDLRLERQITRLQSQVDYPYALSTVVSSIGWTSLFVVVTRFIASFFISSSNMDAFSITLAFLSAIFAGFAPMMLMVSRQRRVECLKEDARIFRTLKQKHGELL